MDISTPTVSPLRQRMLDDMRMRMRKMAEHTQDGYIRAVRKLSRQDIYECTRAAWFRLGRQDPNIIAVGHSDSISRGAYRSPQWSVQAGQRWSFIASEEDWLSDNTDLVGRNFRQVLWLAPHRLRNGVIGVKFDGEGRFTFFQGAPTHGNS